MGQAPAGSMQAPYGSLQARGLWLKVIAWAILDESDTYGDDTDLWDDDVAYYDDQRGQIEGRTRHTFLNVADPEDRPVRPANRSFPDALTVIDFPRDPARSDFVDAWERSRDAGVTPDLVIEIDESGSMTEDTVQPALDEFVSWLGSNYPEVSVTKRKGDPREQWVRWLGQALEDARTGSL